MPQQLSPTMQPDSSGALAAIRRDQRARRAALSPPVIRRMAHPLTSSAWRLASVCHARRLALYWATGGEVPCDHLARQAWRQGRQVYLPVLAGAVLRFAPYGPDTPLRPNQFGIPEPAGRPGQLLPASAMDTIIAPVVAFDRHGTRLGMGGGFYDRSLACLALRRHFLRPHFIGLAWEFQRVAELPRRAWDVPLHAVVTERLVYRCASRAASA